MPPPVLVAPCAEIHCFQGRPLAVPARSDQGLPAPAPPAGEALRADVAPAAGKSITIAAITGLLENRMSSVSSPALLGQQNLTRATLYALWAVFIGSTVAAAGSSEEDTSELQSSGHL